MLKSLSRLSRNYNNLSGGEVIYKKLQENNVKDVFLYTGGAVMPLIDAFYNGDINYYINTHEQSGGHAATGYAKSTGKPGVSIVTSGPGLTNSLTALTDATNDSTPFVLFSGNVPLSAVGTNAFQECPATEITKPVTKWSYLVKNTQELPDVVDEAFRVALDGKPGSVHIDLPKCITMGKYKIKRNYIKQNYNNKITKTKKTSLDISDLINESKSPVLLVGQGCNDYSEELRIFAKSANIPVTTTIHGMGVFDETDDLSLQFLGMHGNVAANYAIQNSDLIIALGTRFDDRITGNVSKYAPEAFKAFKKGKGGIIHVNKNNEEIKSTVNSHYNFNTDCGEFLNFYQNKLKFNERKDWFQKIKEWENKHPFDFNKSEYKLTTPEVLNGINQFLLNYSKKYIVTTGVGNHQMMAAQFIKWRYPKTFISSGSLGVMGTGLPYAVGCQIGNPDSLVIDIDGDGSFNQTLSELKTIQNYNLPIKIAIMNDSNLSMVKAWEELFFNKRYTATDLNINPNYAELAQSFGIEGIKCDNRENLNSIIDYFLSYKKPILCDFRVESELCLPLVSPGAALDNIVHFNHNFNNESNIINTHLPPS
jgi:acetolactate synthase-1/2/3 large subunit